MSDIKLHWMQNNVNVSMPVLKAISKKLNDSGYYSVLLPFNVNGSDAWIRSAHCLNTDEKIKYMIALRPYHISPQYFKMMMHGFSDIQEDRLIINFIAGDGRKDEPDQTDFYGETKNLIEVDQRKIYVRKFLEMQSKDPVIKNLLQETVISGLSDYTVETANIFGYTLLCMYDEYLNNIDRLKDCSRRMVSLRICIRDTDEEAINLVLNSDDLRHKEYTLSGTEDTVFKKIQDAIGLGVTDFLIGGHDYDDQQYRIHKFVKSIHGML